MGKIRNDIILISIVILFIIASIFVIWPLKWINNSEEKDLYVNIYKEDELLYSIPLDENKEIDVNGKIGNVHIVILDGYVYVSDADCPNHICIKEGKKNKNNDTITCLPNMVYIKIGVKIDE